MNYYNEIDPYAAQWIRNLIARGLIPFGVVDTRSIEDIKPSELAPYTQCHFFAGIAGWSLALRLAGIPDSLRIWTGSCPCQPFSAAGAGAGFADERHLWPAFYHLIRECRPAIVAGEQVASKAVDPWIDLVRDDLETLDYAFGAVAFPSAGVGAPHIRDRTYWLGYADHARPQGHAGYDGAARREGSRGSDAAAGVSVRLADDNSQRCVTPSVGEFQNTERHSESCGSAVGLGHAAEPAREWDARSVPAAEARQYGARLAVDGGLPVGFADAGESLGERPGPTNGHWAAADWLGCRDGKWRPVEPGAFPLAHGVSGRVGRLCAYGNAINPYQAAEFLNAALQE